MNGDGSPALPEIDLPHPACRFQPGRVAVLRVELLVWMTEDRPRRGDVGRKVPDHGKCHVAAAPTPGGSRPILPASPSAVVSYSLPSPQLVTALQCTPGGG